MSITKRSLAILAFASSTLMMCSGSDTLSDEGPVSRPPTEQELIEQKRIEQLLKKLPIYRAESTVSAPQLV